MRVLDFSAEFQNTEVSAILLKSDCTTDALPTILKNLGTNKGNTSGGVSFRYSYWWVDWAARFFLKETLIRRYFS